MAKNDLREISLCCIDLLYTEHWFTTLLELKRMGGRRRVVRFGDEGRTEAMAWWLDGGRDAPCIGLYQFSDPLSDLLPYDYATDDPGIVRIGFRVSNFDALLVRLGSLHDSPLAGPTGDPGQRLMTVRSPDGLLVDIVEGDTFEGDTGAAILSSVTIASTDADRTGAILDGVLPAPGEMSPEGARSFRIGAACEVVLLPARAGASDVERRDVPRQGGFRLGFAEAIAAPDGASETYDSFLAPEPGGEPPAIFDPGSGLLFAREDSAHVHSEERPTPAYKHVHSRVFVNASPERIWHALNDHERMPQWLEAEKLEIISPGAPFETGFGAVRILTAFNRRVVQQITRIRQDHIGYRAIGGTPFRYHNGTVDMRTTDNGVQVDWRIRFETHELSVGDSVQPSLQDGIEHQMVRFKTMLESEMAGQE